jgi:hypothetical protein
MIGRQAVSRVEEVPPLDDHEGDDGFGIAGLYVPRFADMRRVKSSLLGGSGTWGRLGLLVWSTS